MGRPEPLRRLMEEIKSQPIFFFKCPAMSAGGLQTGKKRENEREGEIARARERAQHLRITGQKRPVYVSKRNLATKRAEHLRITKRDLLARASPSSKSAHTRIHTHARAHARTHTHTHVLQPCIICG